ncbi:MULTISPECIES: hypothetical protein [unclassified Corallococcus]|uniref:hypothetical protein n=1 Tax=unclassified Corallococcus TaxID=2685029 RepID=UPI001A8EDCC5|nr:MULTISPECIES: hypothetical protein [unclassified Corallococcus]MBN9682100.1 hypothetical protein [Corallococcus sp. NCSPR001]WAS86339.1 hypothetical protein O0N60_05040 [Corallococcus sp. NCRR]
MGSRLIHVLLVSVVTVVGLLVPWVQADDWVRLLATVLGSAAVWRLSPVEQGVVHRLAELGVFCVAGAMLGNAQAFALRRAGLQVPGWAGRTAMAVAVGLVGSRALAVALGLSPGTAAIGMGMAVGLTQGWLLRREAHGAAVWVAACTVGYGMAGPAADWRDQAWRAAVDVGATWRLSSIVITAQAMTWGALALCTAIGGAFILSSLRAQVLPAPGSRMPGAVGQFAVLGLALPLMVALEAREKSPLSLASPAPNPPRLIQPRPMRTWGTDQPVEVFSPGCSGRGCGPAQTLEGGPRPAPVLHDEHLRELFREERKRMPPPSPGRRWNNPASGDAQLPAGATGGSTNSVVY